MNASLSLTTGKWLREASYALAGSGIPSAQLDALIMLELTLKKDRAHLLAHPEYILEAGDITKLSALLSRRQQREPLAYLTGTVEFYGRNFIVSREVLVPRPESEAIIEELIGLPLRSNSHVIDVGTGSGILGVTAALELPQATITLADVSEDALAIAKQNAELHGIRPTYLHSHLLSATSSMYDVIIANLPYVDPTWDRSPETDHEPKIALFANDDGLELIKQLLVQATSHLVTDGYILLEADPRQFNRIMKHARLHGFKEAHRHGYCLVLTA